MGDIRVAVVEDDSALRASIQRMVNRFEGCSCVGAFANGAEALEGLPARKPDVVLMDINLPGLSGIDCVSQLKPLMKGTEFIMLTVYEDSETIFSALSAGASGYLLKRSEPDELRGAILQVHGGGAPMDTHIARKVIQAFRKDTGTEEKESAKLTAREREVLDLLARGMLYKEIADKLEISYPTVNNHVRHIYEKLHVRSRSEAIARYLGHDKPGTKSR